MQCVAAAAKAVEQNYGKYITFELRAPIILLMKPV